MASEENSDQEPAERQTEEPKPSTGAPPATHVKARQRTYLQSVGRDLTQKEIAQTGVQKLFLAEIERLDGENANLRDFRDRFYEADKKVAILEAEKTANRSADKLANICLAVGAAGLSTAPFYIPLAKSVGWMMAVLALALFGAGTYPWWGRR